MSNRSTIIHHSAGLIVLPAALSPLFLMRVSPRLGRVAGPVRNRYQNLLWASVGAAVNSVNANAGLPKCQGASGRLLQGVAAATNTSHVSARLLKSGGSAGGGAGGAAGGGRLAGEINAGFDDEGCPPTEPLCLNGTCVVPTCELVKVKAPPFPVCPGPLPTHLTCS